MRRPVWTSRAPCAGMSPRPQRATSRADGPHRSSAGVSPRPSAARASFRRAGTLLTASLAAPNASGKLSPAAPQRTLLATGAPCADAFPRPQRATSQADGSHRSSAGVSPRPSAARASFPPLPSPRRMPRANCLPPPLSGRFSRGFLAPPYQRTTRRRRAPRERRGRWVCASSSGWSM